MNKPGPILRLGLIPMLAAFAIAAGTAESGLCQNRPSPGGAVKAVPNHDWILTGGLNVARCGHTATLLPNGKVLVVGGSNSRDCSSVAPNTLSSAELYDPVSGSWSATGSLIQARTNHTATLLPNGLVLVAGGIAASDSSYEIFGGAELYDPATGHWKSTGGMIAPRAYHTASLLQNGSVLVAGGWSGGASGTLDSAELYDPSTATWSFTGNLITGRLWHTATELQSGKVLVAGGVLDASPGSGMTKGSAELYDPLSGAWTQAGDLNNDRSQHTATRLQNGQVLVASGDNPYDDYGNSPGTAEIYDPDTAAWAITGDLLIIRDGHTATLLPSGKVLVNGGAYFSSGNPAEVFDPVSGSWSPTGPVSTSRFFGHTATLLADGKVLVAGGASESTTPTALASAELYDDGTSLSSTVEVIEYFHPAFNHYFITSVPDEITKLDHGTFDGWVRTGRQFKAFAAASGNSAPVCRFFSTAFGPKSSHFYTPFVDECAITRANTDWKLESSDVFEIAVPTAAGSCGEGLVPVYRLFNNGQGGAPNHRYTTDLEVRAQMIAQGWVPEGFGPDAVEMCSPR